MPLEEIEIVPDEDIYNWFFYIELQKMFYEFDMAMEQGYMYE